MKYERVLKNRHVIHFLSDLKRHVKYIMPHNLSQLILGENYVNVLNKQPIFREVKLYSDVFLDGSHIE
jgi:hypothetical protein